VRPALSGPTLVLDAAGGAGRLAVLDGDCLLAQRDWSNLRDATARLGGLAADALADAGIAASALSCVAVVVGPGSFTGLRASVAFAQGLALAISAALIPVTVDEAGESDGSGRTPARVAAAAARRHAGLLPSLPPLPVYAGPAQARAVSTRPAPA
jgi:tRNA threonylcarbamoyl adenosine modification protein YeaZ